MIVRMSKIEIIGPKDLALEVLSFIQGWGVLQIEQDIGGTVNERVEPYMKSLLLDKETLSERLFFEDLRKKIEALLACLPEVAVRETYLNPPRALEAVNTLVEQHAATCQALGREKAALQNELEESERIASFLSTIEPLVKEVQGESDLDIIGMEIKDPAQVEKLRRLAHRLTEGRFEIQTIEGPDGALFGLIATEKGLAEPLKRALAGEKMPEFSLPPPLANLPFPEKIQAVRKRLSELTAELAGQEAALTSFAQRWLPIYRRVWKWLGGQLALLQQTASLFETEMCFFILGWIPSTDLKRIENELAGKFGGRVVVEEKEILEQDVERVPVALKNPTYFQPFELFARLLPLPRYGSFDPTPFIGLFFPLFFGMILGDIGYGLILLLTALALVFLVKNHKNLIDAGKILGVAALYTIFFGWLYGECFGEFGSHLLGLEPICFDRLTAIVPMLYFALSVGVCHVVLGLTLGTVSAFKRKMKREALFKLFSILVILCLVVFFASFYLPFPELIRKPLLVTMAIIIPILLLTGGLLAPLELLKHLGNIISYARIMAVGLTSVLLAYVANQLGGMAGNIFVGILVATLLHAFNLLLGVFAPTIHSLRLHYVEFFGKFLEPGGRKFEPTGKNQGGGSWKK